MDDDWGTWTPDGKAELPTQQPKQPVPEPKNPPKTQQHWTPPLPPAPPTQKDYDQWKPKLKPSPKVRPQRQHNGYNNSRSTVGVTPQVANTAKDVLKDFHSVSKDILDELTAAWQVNNDIDKPMTGISERLRQQNGGKTQRGTHPRAGRKLQRGKLIAMLSDIATAA